MSVEPGTRFGPYEIAESIGAGGMGEVWRATDTNLKRDVAVKVLPQSFAEDADRVARFRREAEILASLNHPNIAQVYGLEQTDGQLAIVMELVEGPTLADRIAEGPIPLEEAMSIAMQIAAALEAAHGRQIVHRDLKPANIKRRDDGTVKVLDFGISKPLDASAISGGSPVITTPAVTETGVILGTAAYMSPEQARGKLVDERTDIWAFGCLLFEMLTGQPAFAGEDVMMTLARVLDRETDLSTVPRGLSPAVRHTIGLCLQKDPGKRIADIRDVRLALGGAFESERPRAVAAGPGWRRALVPASALVAGVCVTALVGVVLWPAPPVEAVTRIEQPIPEGLLNHQLDVSDDGSRVAYVTANPRGVVVRDLDAFSARPVEATRGQPVLSVCFSPGGDEIAYTVDAVDGLELRRAPLTGSDSRGIAPVPAVDSAWCDWSEDGQIYLGAFGRGILRVSESGAVGTVVTPGPESGALLARPRLLPGGRRLLYNAIGGASRSSVSILVHDVETGHSTRIVEEGGAASFVPVSPGSSRGHLVYGRDGVLFAAPIDAGAEVLESADPRRVVEGVLQLTGGVLTASDISRSGTLAYFAPGGSVEGNARDDTGDAAAAGQLSTLMLVDRGGNGVALDSRDLHAEPAVCDGDNRAVATIADLDSGGLDLAVFALENGRAPMPLPLDGDNAAGIWSPDCSRIYHLRRRNAAGAPLELRSITADLSETPVTHAVFEESETERFTFDAIAPTPEGVYAVGTRYSDAEASGDLWVLPLDDYRSGDMPATTDDLIVRPDPDVAIYTPEVSPNGRWIAYSAARGGRREIHVRTFPELTGSYVVSIDDGRQPRWHPDGGELFFIANDALMAARYSADERFASEDPEVVFEDAQLLSLVTAGSFANLQRTHYDYSAALDRFVIPVQRTAVSDRPVSLRIVRSFAADLRELAPWPSDWPHD